jgi:hypothetical protein
VSVAVLPAPVAEVDCSRVVSLVHAVGTFVQRAPHSDLSDPLRGPPSRLS